MWRTLVTLVKGYGKIGDMLYSPKKPIIPPIVSRRRNGNIEFTKLVSPDLQTDFAYILTQAHLPTTHIRFRCQVQQL